MMDFDAAARDGLDRLETRVSGIRVGVVGDVILDQFVYGSVERVSPEAPVPVVDVEREVLLLGGAANVVHNMRSLGANPDLVGIVGTDSMAEVIRDHLRSKGLSWRGLVEVDGRPTAVKTRIIAQHQQVVRFDREARTPVPSNATAGLVAHVSALMPELDVVVVSDYGKGVVTGGLMAELLQTARAQGTLVAVDPTPENSSYYRGADVITPNTQETERMTGGSARSDDDAVSAGRRLVERFDTRTILVTRGEKGMTLVERGGEPTHIPTRARDVFDVTGAGDTTISVFTLGLAAGADARQAACLANLAAGIVVGKLGTAVVTAEELRDAANRGIGAAARPDFG
jgi:D-beta-D-heptose 7-phosphate kinase/D-beta-D-heptose 1-phosphate adenosyltransferase